MIELSHLKHNGNYITDLFVFKPQNTVLLSYFVVSSLAVFLIYDCSRKCWCSLISGNGRTVLGKIELECLPIMLVF